jgi:hypothetical protein
MLFKNPLDPENKQAIEFIKKWTKEVAHIDEDAAISILETACVNPDCPGTSTTITITGPQKNTKSFSLHKPLVFIRKTDIEKLLS